MSDRFRPVALAWEAVISAEFTLDQVRRRAVTLAEGLVGRGLSCVVAFDTRFMGALFARDLVATLQTLGVRAHLVTSPVPLPALAHALDQRLADTGLYLSAGNRPYFYNGLALLARDPTGLSLDPSSLPPPTTPFPPLGEFPLEYSLDLRTTYLDALRRAVDLDLIRRTSLTIFVDAMNGTTAGILPALLSEGGQTRAIEINREADPLFARTAPDPTVASLTRLKKLVRESDSHIGLALAGDGTALVVVDKNGEQLDPAETALLLAAYLSRQYRQRGPLVLPAPAPSSPLAGIPRMSAWEEATGLRIEGLSDPVARLHELINKQRTLPVLGATAAGELIIGRYAAYPDALLAGLLCVELVARSGGSLRTLIEQQREHIVGVV